MKQIKEVIELIENAKRGEEIKRAIEEGFMTLDISVKTLFLITVIQGIAIIIIGIGEIMK